MKYMLLPVEQRAELMASLEEMPRYLERMFDSLPPELISRRSLDDLFSPVEQTWHLADLEREGFECRIEKLLAEPEPQLPDFDGAAIAITRQYRLLSLPEGLAAFREARERNLSRLRSLIEASWTRSGFQDGVGRVSLCDMPSLMAQHDAAHRAEIESWRKQVMS